MQKKNPAERKIMKTEKKKKSQFGWALPLFPLLPLGSPGRARAVGPPVPPVRASAV